MGFVIIINPTDICRRSQDNMQPTKKGVLRWRQVSGRLVLLHSKKDRNRF